jgi:hypothetical protein
MQDRELYRQILGIEAPWLVERVELKLAEGEVHAVDKVRRKENQTLRAAGDDRLTGTRYDWLRNPAGRKIVPRPA